MFKEKPVISNQHGALVMAFVPYGYGIWASHFISTQLWLGLTWFFLYLFSYPFLALFSKKPTPRNQKWAFIYALISVVFALPLLYQQFAVLQFLGLIVPLVAIQIYFARQKNERHLANDIAAILIFGVVGMATYYLATEQYNWLILLHPSLFFIATTFYIKSVARERKNPHYLKLSLAFHLLCAIAYLTCGNISLSLVYLIALARAFLIPQQKWHIKQIGLFEFIMVGILLVGLAFA